LTGIDDLFREFSEPDEFHVAAQLELFAWAQIQRQGHGYVAYTTYGCRCGECRQANREYMRGYLARKYGKTTTRAYRCGQCGENGHNANTCMAERRAA
jgi:hypothetical protein